MIDARRHVVPAFVAWAVFGPTLWWLMDRDPPYVRESGVITAAEPERCGLPDNTPIGLYPGSCVGVEWAIKPKRACPSSGEFNVHRTLIDSVGEGARHALPATTSIYGRTSSGGTLARYFVIPKDMPIGVTQYASEACFACNPLQHVVFPLCVNTPMLSFTVSEPPKGEN